MVCDILVLLNLRRENHMSVTVEIRNTIVSQGINEYPLIRREVEYEEMENPPSFPKFMKNYQKNQQQFDSLWKQCLNIVQHFRDFDFLYRTCFSDTTFYKMLEMYAEIDLDIKEFNKSVKKCDQVVKEYYNSQEFSDFFNINVFDLIKQDYETYYGIAKVRHTEYLNKYPDAIQVLNDNTTDYLKEYKNAIKRVKAKRDSKNKG